MVKKEDIGLNESIESASQSSYHAAIRVTSPTTRWSQQPINPRRNRWIKKKPNAVGAAQAANPYAATANAHPANAIKIDAAPVGIKNVPAMTKGVSAKKICSIRIGAGIIQLRYFFNPVRAEFAT